MQLAEPKLLIADDDRDFRESLGEVFERRGYSIRLAADGQEAIEQAEALYEAAEDRAKLIRRTCGHNDCPRDNVFWAIS